MTTTRYSGPSRKETRKGTCPTCGKPATRTATFSGTVNPFNTNPDGTVKTYAQVAADVREHAKAWTPDADEFEHQKCLAARIAPEPSGTVPVDSDRLLQADRLRDALRSVADFTARNGLPLTAVNLRPRPVCQQQPPYLSDVSSVASEIVLWARAFNLDTVRVEDAGHSTYLRAHRDVESVTWRVSAVVYKPAVGDRLGDAPIKWSGGGKRRKYGTVRVDDLAAGLSRMGIAVAVAGGAG